LQFKLDFYLKPYTMKVVILFLLLFINQNALLYSQEKTIEYFDLITFDTAYPYLTIDTSSQCIWQIASPQKPYFNAPYSGQKAILTDSINPYPVNNLSYFDLKIGNFNIEHEYPYNFCMEIQHKYDTDSLADGGFITISYDNGTTWKNIFTDDNNFWELTPFIIQNSPMSDDYGIYTDSLVNDELGFSGRSDGWVTTRLEWITPYAKSDWIEPEDTIVLRFNFISDDQETNKEGWMIDDIQLYAVVLGGAVENYGDNDLIKLYPNPAEHFIIIELDRIYQDIFLELIDLKGTVLDVIQYSNTNHMQIEYDPWSKGINFLRIRLNHETVITKRIISGN